MSKFRPIERQNWNKLCMAYKWQHDEQEMEDLSLNAVAVAEQEEH